jgi:guanylate cyclase soluble subunit beta
VEVIKYKSKDCDHVQFAITQKDKPPGPVDPDRKGSPDRVSKQKKISPATFCRAFPFHFMYDRNMILRQAGSSLQRVIPHTGMDNCRVDTVFEMIRPHMDFEFNNVLSHINTVYVLRTKPGILDSDGLYLQTNMTEQNDISRMRLKGQMIYVPESDMMLFLCSPSVTNLDDLHRKGLYLSDIPLHDATRDLVLLSERFEADYKLAQNLEVLNDQLQQTHRELEDEKAKTDRYVYKSCQRYRFV